MKRILQATIANDKGGLTGYIINNYRRIDKEKIQFDFITYDDSLDFSAEILGLGAKVFCLPRPSHWFSYYKKMKELQSKNHYDCIHFHLSYANPLPVLAAKLSGFSRIIVHSHSTGFDENSYVVQSLKMLLHLIGKRLLPWLATDCFACSKLAAEWMFPSSVIEDEKYQIMYNAILLDKFRFNEEQRAQARESLNIPPDYICVGHVGRFTYQKNHEKLIGIFERIHEKNKKSLLMLVGDGENRKSIETMVERLRLKDSVLFLGNRRDVSSLYQAMDALVLPSRFEGLCIVAIEAQMAGLPCICSDRLTMETKVTDSYVSVPLEADSEIWANEILRVCEMQRCDQTETLRAAGYDSDEEIRRLEKIYGQMNTGLVKVSK